MDALLWTFSSEEENIHNVKASKLYSFHWASKNIIPKKESAFRPDTEEATMLDNNDTHAVGMSNISPLSGMLEQWENNRGQI